MGKQKLTFDRDYWCSRYCDILPALMNRRTFELLLGTILLSFLTSCANLQGNEKLHDGKVYYRDDILHGDGQVVITVRDGNVSNLHDENFREAILLDYRSKLVLRGDRSAEFVNRLLKPTLDGASVQVPEDGYVFSPEAAIEFVSRSRARRYYIDGCLVLDDDSGKFFPLGGGVLEWLSKISAQTTQDLTYGDYACPVGKD